MTTGLFSGVVVMFSSGAGSWAAAKRAVEKHGTGNVKLLFCDVKGEGGGEHDGEDADNYRFLHEAAGNLGAELVQVRDGRSVWDVFRDERIIGNTRIAPCSKRLKQEPARKWIEANCSPDATLVVGIDWSEAHRLPAIERGWAPYNVWAPLTEAPYVDKDEILAWLRAEGIEPPRLYAQGFSHANCGGFCVRGGQGHFKTLLEQNPDRFAYHEAKENEMRDFLGKDVSILRDRTEDARLQAYLDAHDLQRWEVQRVQKPDEDYMAGPYEDTRPGRSYWQIIETLELFDLPTVATLPLTVLRQRIQGQDEIDELDIGGCGCFVDQEFDD